MAKAGRNDLCPCGSGKKYKNCCMLQDRISSARSLNLDSDAAALLGQLYQLAQTRRFAAQATNAFMVFWGGAYDLAGLQQVDPEDVQRTFEWFVHDVPIDEEHHHIIDLMIEQKPAQVPQNALPLLQAWAASTTGVFRVVATGDRDQLELWDPLRQQELQAYDATLARNAQRGELIVGRLYDLGGSNRLSMMSFLFPQAYEEPLVAFAQNAFRLYRDEHPQADWDLFLRENGHLFNAFMLSEQAAALRGLIGPGTRYHDPAITRDRLRAFTQERRAELQKERQQEQATKPSGGRTPRAPVQRTDSGIILPGAPPKPTAPAAKETVDEKPRILIPGRDS